MRYVLAIFLSMSLVGCMSFEWKIPQVQRSELSQHKSVVVVSTWAPGKSIASASELTIHRKSDGSLAGAGPIDNYALKPHFQDGWGFLHVFQMSPGDYVISLGATNPYDSYKGSESPLEFTVPAGKMVYLGEAAFHREPGAGVIEMRNRFERDIALFLAHNPGFESSEFITIMPMRRP